MAVSLIRGMILYFTVVILYRVMGKRQIGEMQPGELVLAIMISDMAAVPLQSVGTPLTSGLVPILGLMGTEVILSFVAQKSNFMRKIITGKPSLVVAEGKLVKEEMERLRFNIDDLFEQLRNSGVFDINDVSFAVLETNGNLSVLQKNSESDNKKQTTFPSNVIKDGVIDKEALHEIGKDRKWLEKELRKRSIASEKQVFLLCADKNHVTYIQKQKEK